MASVTNYTNISDATTRKAFAYLEINCNEGCKKTVSRAAHLGLVPASVVTNTIDLTIGIFAGFAVLFTASTKKSIIDFMFNHLGPASATFLTMPYIGLIKMLNPDFKSNDIPEKGLVTSTLTETLLKSAFNNAMSKDTFKRHVTSRLTFLLAGIAAIVTSVVDTIVGVLAATLSLLALGRWKSMNAIAIRAFAAPGTLIVAIGIIGTFFPIRE